MKVLRRREFRNDSRVHHSRPERFRYAGELRLVRKVGVEEEVGLWRAVNIRCSGLR